MHIHTCININITVCIHIWIIIHIYIWRSGLGFSLIYGLSHTKCPISMSGWQIGLSHPILKSSRIREKLHWCVQILTGKTHVNPLLNVWILIQSTCACLQCMGHCRLMIRKSACLQHFIACLVFTWMYPC